MKKEALLVVLLVLISIFVFEYSRTYDQTYLQDKGGSDYIKEFNKLIAWIHGNTEKDDIIFTEWELGTIITGYTGRKSVATTKVYPSEAALVSSRYKDINGLFFADNEEDALKLMNKYNSRYVLVRRNFNLKVCKYTNSCRVENYISSFNFLGSPNLTERYMLGRLFKYENLVNFELIYSSNFFKIYKIRKDYKKPIGEAKISLDSGFYNNKKIIEQDYKEIATSLHKKYLLNIVGGIVPHDTSYSHKMISTFFASLGDNYSNIIMIATDHNYVSRDFAVTSLQDWSTPFGVLKTNIDSVNKLGIKEDDFALLTDHSIRELLLFIKYYYPDARVIPILIREDTDARKYVLLGQKIFSISNSSTLILLNLDFSHIDGIEDTKLNFEHDTKSWDIMKNLDINKVPEMEIEAKNPVYVFLSAMKYKNATNVQLLNISNIIQKENGRAVGFITAVYSR